MNSTFADMSSTFLNMVGQNLSKDLLPDTNTAGSQNQLFAEKLSKILEKKERFNDADQLQPALGPSLETPNKMFDTLSEKLDDKTGVEFVLALKNIFLMLSKGELKKATIDADGLETLKKMLVKAGFKEADIDDLIAEFKEESESKDLPLNDFLEKLFDLPFDAAAEIESSPENFIETSALPFLESILNSLGLPREKIHEIINQADKGEKGLSLDTIIENLQAVQKKSFYTQNHYHTRTGDDNFRPLLKQLGLESDASEWSQLFQSGDNRSRQLKAQLGLGQGDVKTSPLSPAGDEILRHLKEQLGLVQGDVKPSPLSPAGDEILRQLKAQLGLEQGDVKTPQFSPAGDERLRPLLKQLEPVPGESKPLTLNKLVDSLETLRQRISLKHGVAKVPTNNESAPIAGEKSQDLLNTLFKGVKLEEKPIETQAFEFSHEQIKDQFKTAVSLPANGENQKTLLSPQKLSQHATDAKLKQNFKEMESLLGSKKPAIADMSESREGRGFLKQTKSRNSTLSDQTQISTSDLKTDPAESSQNLSKSKSSFKNLPTYVTNQVSKGLVRAINQGENTIKIQLKPSELGRLVMTIDNTGNSMKVSIMTDNSVAKDVLTSNVSELRTLLSHSGVTLESFDVDMDSNFKQSMADARNPGGKFGKQNQNRGNGSLDAMDDPLTDLNDLNPDSSLHFVA